MSQCCPRPVSNTQRMFLSAGLFLMVFGGLIKSVVSLVLPVDFTMFLYFVMFCVSGFYMANGYPLRFSRDYFPLLMLLFSCLVIQIFSLIYTISSSASYFKLGVHMFLNIGAFIVTYYLVSQKLVLLRHLKWAFFILATIISMFVFFMMIISGGDIQFFLQILAVNDPRFANFSFLDYLSFGTFLISALLIDIESPKAWKRFFFAAFLLADIFLGGRAPTVLFFLIFAIHTVWRWPVRKLAFVVPVLIAGAIFLVSLGVGDRLVSRINNLGGDASLGGRSELFSDAFRLISESPLTGVGIGGFGVATEGKDYNAYPHNIFLEIGSETGVVAAGLILCFFIYVFGFLFTKVRRYRVAYPIYLTGVYIFFNSMKSGSISDLRILMFWASLLVAILYLCEKDADLVLA